jgi:hypothetical protein
LTTFLSVLISKNSKRVRIDTTTDTAVAPTLSDLGTCATGAAPEVSFIGGTASVKVHGGTASIAGGVNADGNLVFGPLTVPPAEAGVILATDANRNVLEIVWPSLAGTGVGSPIVRVQLGTWNQALLAATQSVDVSYAFTVSGTSNGLPVQVRYQGGVAGVLTNGTAFIPPATTPPPACPVSLPASPLQFVTQFAQAKRQSNNRLRLELTGDAVPPFLNPAGTCITSATPSINIPSATANVFLKGTTTSVTSTGSALSFTGIAVPPPPGEPGVVLATDANRNVFEIIWPPLAGTGVGPPIVRVQLATWNTALVPANTALDVVFSFVANSTGQTDTTSTVTVNGTGSLNVP